MVINFFVDNLKTSISIPDLSTFSLTNKITLLLYLCRGEAWHRLRHDDFAQVDFVGVSHELVELIKHMMRSDPALRVEAGLVAAHPVVTRARALMETLREERGAVFGASPLASVGEGWLEEILNRDEDIMDLGF